MTAEDSKAANESEIRQLFNDQVKAIRAGDVKGATSSYAPNVLSFDVVNPLQKTGLEACRKRTEEWFSSFQGAIGFEHRDLTIIAGDDVAFCHSLNHVDGTKTDGAKLEMWWRATFCLRKIDDKWLITHEHASVPFDVETGHASLDLKP
ncbi:MAG: nuclear transport factor 2 family protein [Acidobacteriota bacterium]